MSRSEPRLSPAVFVTAVGADAKWVHNTAAVLGRRFRHTVSEAMRLGLVRELHAGFGIPLRRADSIAGQALSDSRDVPPVIRSAEGSAELAIDLERYASTFNARLSAARTLGAKQRGRRPRRGADPIAAAKAHGVDAGLLAASMALSPAERLRRLDENAAFLRALRPSADSRSRDPD